MAATLSAPPELVDSLAAFVIAESIDVNVSCEAGGEVRVAPGRKGGESSLETIEAGGWMACKTAWAMARKLGIPTRQMGAILDFLDVKIRKCALGCFE